MTKYYFNLPRAMFGVFNESRPACSKRVLRVQRADKNKKL